jgi:A/G-specific adenine glycosylase
LAAPHPFTEHLITWQKVAGRHDLPWQKTRDPYRIWLSEIMLQQTQVTTVIPYYQRFLDSFPDIQALAAASIDSVIEHWAGLGYYARARNLHRCAQQIAAVNSRNPPNFWPNCRASDGPRRRRLPLSPLASGRRFSMAM